MSPAVDQAGTPKRTAALLSVLAVLGATVIAAQTPQPQSTFAVVAIHQGAGPEAGWGINFTPEGLQVLNATLRYMIQEAYGIEEENRFSGPAWIDSTRFDILAKVDAADLPTFQKASAAERRLMFQQLLRTRFNLQAHLEVRDIPAYALVFARGDPKLQPTDPSKSTMNDASGKPICHFNHPARPEDWPMLACSLGDLARNLSRVTRRPVIDQTGLVGQFDLRLHWDEGSGPDSTTDGLTLFNALQDQLGLRLKEIRTPLQTIVVDHVERPSQN